MARASQAARQHPLAKRLVAALEFPELDLVLADLLDLGLADHEVGRQVEELHRAFVADVDHLVRVEHDEALVHIFERRLDEAGLPPELGLRAQASPPLPKCKRTGTRKRKRGETDRNNIAIVVRRPEKMDADRHGADRCRDEGAEAPACHCPRAAPRLPDRRGRLAG